MEIELIGTKYTRFEFNRINVYSYSWIRPKQNFCSTSRIFSRHWTRSGVENITAFNVHARNTEYGKGKWKEEKNYRTLLLTLPVERPFAGNSFRQRNDFCRASEIYFSAPEFSENNGALRTPPLYTIHPVYYIFILYVVGLPMNRFYLFFYLFTVHF